MRIAVSRAPGVEREVTPLELFFDLVYVFAIGQLSHHLVAHLDLRTAAETLVLALGETGSDQAAQRFADGRAADSEGDAQLQLGGDVLPGPQPSGEELTAKLGDQRVG